MDVILVNEYDDPIGTMEKMEAHRTGALHRAFSVFIFNSKGEMLLQQRAAAKYHSGGLWTNSCCSHPMPGENTTLAAKRRVHEELGISCDPEFMDTFMYRVSFSNGLIEHELDHVFKASSDATPVPDPTEVQQTRWIAMDELLKWLEESPSDFTYWFRLAIEKYFG